MVGYVLDNDAYIATDYVDTAYVGTDNDLLYVEDGYVGVIQQASASLSNNSFINAVPNKITPAVATVDAVAAVSSTPNRIMPFSATLGGDGAASITASAKVRPGADLVASSTVTIAGSKITGVTKNIIQAGDETTWETALTWANPRQDVWAKRVAITATAFKPSSGSYTVNSTLSADGDRTARIDIVVESTGSLSAIGGSSLVGSSSVSSNATLSANALKNPVGVANLNSSATLSSNAIYVVNGRTDLSSNATVSTLGTRIIQSSSTLEGSREPLAVSKLGSISISNAQAKFGTNSLYYSSLFDGIKIAGDTKFGRGDFTVDMWIYKSNITTGTYTLFDNRYLGDGLVVRISSNRIGVLATGDSVITYSASTNFTNNTWHHIAFTRSGTELKVYVDGTSVITHTVVDNDWNNPSAIGRLLTSLVSFNGGYIDEIRFSTGVRYNSNFTSPTNAFETDANTRFLFTAENGFEDESVIPMLVSTGTRVRRHEKTLNATATITRINGTTNRNVTSSIDTAAAGISVEGSRFPGVYQLELRANATIEKALAGRLIDFARELVTESSASVRGQLTKLIIDPYRVYTIVDEGRSLQIVEESRIKTLKSENRVNTLQAETRGYPVRSETRNVEVENSVLVEVLDPLDRRE